MEFRLYYRGPLKSNGDVKHKHAIREQIHSQLKQLWNQKPLSDLKEKLLSGQEEFSAVGWVEERNPTSKHIIMPGFINLPQVTADPNSLLLKPT